MPTDHVQGQAGEVVGGSGDLVDHAEEGVPFEIFDMNDPALELIAVRTTA